MSSQRLWREAEVSRENREGCTYNGDDKRGIRRGKKSNFKMEYFFLWFKPGGGS